MNPTPANQNLNQLPPPKRRRLLPRLIAWFVALGLVTLLAWNWQWITDQFVAWRYPAPAEVVQLANRAGLNQTGELYLFASRAEVNDKTSFNQACGSLQNEKTVVMGCYTGRFGKIHIYDVTDSRLDGIKETTAAHEMLHAAFDRLNPVDKASVEKLLLAEKDKLTDERLKKIIAYYEEAEPDEIVNELHSIFGTELRSLSPELEKYYSRYFSNRLAVVELKEKYEKVFSDLSDQQTALVNEMNQLANSINQRSRDYETKLNQLNSDINSFSEWARSGQATRAEYDSRRAVLEGRISAINQERESINSSVDRHKQLATQLDSLNLQSQELNKSIDSKLEAAPSL